jgi:hypothetical protein
MITLIARFLPSLLPAASALLNPWILLAIAAASGWLWFQGYKVGAAKLEAYRSEQLQQATRINTKRAEVTERVVTKYITRIVPQTQIVTETVEKEVIRYAESNPGMCLDGAWRVLHDAAALNTVPDRASLAYGAPGAPPGAAQALGTVTENYAGCHRVADRLEALQDWVKGQQAVK